MVRVRLVAAGVVCAVSAGLLLGCNGGTSRGPSSQGQASLSTSRLPGTAPTEDGGVTPSDTAGQTSGPTPTESTESTTPTQSESPALVEQFLSDMPPVSSTTSVDTSPADVNGKRCLHTVGLTSQAGLPLNEVQYDLGRGWGTLRATVGPTDQSGSRGALRFQVFGDGKQLYAKDLKLGQADELRLDVRRILRLRLVVSFLGSNDDLASYTGAWGDAQLRR